MVMLFNFELNVGYYGDLYVAPRASSHPNACVMCGTGNLLFYSHSLVCQR
jgi:hypothetical protein